MKNVLLVSVLLFVLVSSVFAAGNAIVPIYNGSEMYGYEIISVEYISNDGYTAPTANYNSFDQVKGMAAYCKKELKGLALVNVREVFALGEVSEYSDKETRKGVTTISPAIQYVISAECVTEAKKKSSSFFD